MKSLSVSTPLISCLILDFRIDNRLTFLTPESYYVFFSFVLRCVLVIQTADLKESWCMQPSTAVHSALLKIQRAWSTSTLF